MENFILTISPAVIAGVVTYFTVIKNTFSPIKINIANEQLHKVYLPLFTFIEPYLYKKVPLETLVEFLAIFNNIKSKHYELIDSNLLNEIQLLENSIKHNSYNSEFYDSVCSTLDRLFERTRRYLKLPTRNIFYKINNKQFNRSFKIFSQDILMNMLPPLLLMLSFSIVYLIIFYIFDVAKNIIKLIII